MPASKTRAASGVSARTSTRAADLDPTAFAKDVHPGILRHHVAAGVLMKGYALVRHANGQVTCWPPRFSRDKRRKIQFINGNLKREITGLAVTTFYALSGTDDELHGNNL